MPGMENFPPFEEIFYRFDEDKSGFIEVSELARFLEAAYNIMTQPQPSGPDFHAAARDMVSRYNFDTDYEHLNFDEARGAYDEVNVMLNGKLPPFEMVFYDGDLNYDSHLNVDELAKLLSKAYYEYMSGPPTPDFHYIARDLMNRYNFDTDMAHLNFDEASKAYTEVNGMVNGILPPFEEVFYKGDINQDMQLDENEIAQLIEQAYYLSLNNQGQPQPPTAPDYLLWARDLMARYNFDTDYAHLNLDEAKNGYDETNSMLGGILPPFEEVFNEGDINKD